MVKVVAGIMMDLAVEEPRDVVISNMDKYKEEGEEMDNLWMFSQVEMTNLTNQHFHKLLADQLL